LSFHQNSSSRKARIFSCWKISLLGPVGLRKSFLKDYFDCTP